MTGKRSKFKLGLALSGGGARGLAHIGFLKVLEREHIQVDYLSGTSMGAIIAAAYARGMDLSQMEEEVLSSTTTRSMMRLVSLAPPTRGFIEANKLRALLAHFIPEALTFDDLRIPLAVCATDLIHSTAVTLSKGEVLSAVMASCAIPGIFPAVYLPPHKLVDGGVLNNLPVDLVKELGAEKIVAVDVQANPFELIHMEEPSPSAILPLRLPSTLKDILWSATMMVARLTQVQLQLVPPDLYLRPNIPQDVSLFIGFQKAAEVIEVGEKAAEEYLPQIREILEI